MMRRRAVCSFSSALRGQPAARKQPGAASWYCPVACVRSWWCEISERGGQEGRRETGLRVREKSEANVSVNSSSHSHPTTTPCDSTPCISRDQVLDTQATYTHTPTGVMPARGLAFVPCKPRLQFHHHLFCCLLRARDSLTKRLSPHSPHPLPVLPLMPRRRDYTHTPLIEPHAMPRIVRRRPLVPSLSRKPI